MNTALETAQMTKILIVEDEPNMVAGLRDNFEYDGYEVITAPDGSVGLERALKENPDLVILDVNMPAMTGWEFCAILRRQSTTREVPILFLTGRSEVKDRITAMQLGGSDFLAKPFGADDLRRKVRALLRESHAMEEG